MSIKTSAIHRMGKVFGAQALEAAKETGPKLGRYSLKKRLGRRTWISKDTKRDMVCLVQVLGRKSQAARLAGQVLYRLCGLCNCLEFS